MPPRIEINAQAVIQAVDDLDRVARSAAPSLEKAVKVRAQEALKEVFAEAVRGADSEDGFPKEFQDHVMSSLNQINPLEEVTGGAYSLSFDFDELGGWDDLKRAFHQGARTADGGRIWGPYEGEELAQEDVDKRHAAWLRIRKQAGEEWEETKQQYINIWGEKAPEWKYVQYGQQEWEPYITPQPVEENFQARLNAIHAEIMDEFLDAAVAAVNRYEVEDIESAPIFKGGKLTVSRLLSDIEEIGPSGNPRRAGQFYPLPGRND